MDKLKQIDAAIHRYYERHSQSRDDISSELIEAILYSVDGGGKRVRPLILLELVEAFGVTLTEAHYDVAAALEMIHTGSLIHDDLPAMDDDDYRRGRLTNHKKYGEATAILAGDSLFLDPFSLIAEADLKPAIIVQLIQFLSLSSGTFGMVGGQMLDMTGEGKRLSLPELQNIHINKTGKLLTFPFWVAGVIAEQSTSVVGRLWQVGALVGHAFQVRDDILDVTASFEEIGKTPQKDIHAEKSTYPNLLGLEQSYVVLQDSLDKAQTILKELRQEVEFQPEKIIEMIERLRLDGQGKS